MGTTPVLLLVGSLASKYDGRRLLGIDLTVDFIPLLSHSSLSPLLTPITATGRDTLSLIPLLIEHDRTRG